MSTSLVNQVAAWEKPPFDRETQQAVAALKKNPEALEDAFYKNLAFGTGGMRGVMGVGTNRVNKYTFGRTTQGLSNYLNKHFPNQTPRVVIGYDCRHNSKALAQTVADIFSANGIDVYLFTDLRATPEVSFAVRYLSCQCGVVLTASHNPPEYNGYKVYWEDGGQIVPPQDEGIIKAIDNVDYASIRFDAQASRITHIDKTIDHAFQNASVKTGRIGTGNRSDVNIVFTSLHGTSITAIPQVLEAAGYTQVHIIEEQATPDGDFPTVASPNPEESEALSMAIKKANEIGADIVIGTDPDADRLGIAIRNEKNELELLNGNQTMIAMTDFILSKRTYTHDENPFVGSTIVSTPMMVDLAKQYGVECKLGLTGFKWIAKMIEDYPNQRCLGGGEESFGFMVGDFVRDKDAVTACLLACEVAAYAKQNGSSFYEELLNIYVENKFYKEHLIAITKKGMDGAAEIKKMLSDMRNNPLTMIDGEKVESLSDYQASTKKNIITGEVTTIDLPKSNVLIYQTESGTRIAARPSGTEPKIKFYFSVNTSLDNTENAKKVEKELDAKIQRIIKEMNLK